MPPKRDYHQPYAVHQDRYIDFKGKLATAVEAVKDGLPPGDAVCLAFDIMPERWRRWVNWALEDIENGYTPQDSRLIKLVLELTRVDSKAHQRLSKKAFKVALDDENPSVEMLKFLLERRYGYKKKSAKEVEVATKDDLNFNINIVESSPKKEE